MSTKAPQTIALLRDAVKDYRGTDSQKSTALEEKLFSDIMKDLDVENKKTSQNPAIPRFFFKPRDANSEKFSKDYQRILRRRQLDQLYNDMEQLKISDLRAQLMKHISGPEDGVERINYSDFRTLASQLGLKWQEFFSPAIFLHFRRDSFGRISCANFIAYVEKRLLLQKQYIELSYFDSDGKGYLREEDLEEFICACLKTYDALKVLDDSYHPFYSCAAVRKFVFFNQNSSKTKFPIIDLTLSPTMDEFLSLKQGLSAEEERTNWFSPKAFTNIYNSYLILDRDQDGMLSKDEFLEYPNCRFTQVFVDRLFEELQTYDNNMDFKTFLDFCVAFQNKKSKESIQYFFKILDIRKNGYLSVYEINYFYKEVQRGLQNFDGDIPSVEDVKDEIFDMITPSHALHISLEDLISCGCGDTIITMLIDSRGFYLYDNRERFMQEPQDDYGDENGNDNLS